MIMIFTTVTIASYVIPSDAAKLPQFQGHHPQNGNTNTYIIRRLLTGMINAKYVHLIGIL